MISKLFWNLPSKIEKIRTKQLNCRSIKVTNGSNAFVKVNSNVLTSAGNLVIFTFLNSFRYLASF